MKRLLNLILFLFGCCAYGQAQVDPDFNSPDLGFYNGDGVNSIVPPYFYSPVKKLVLLPDGKLLYWGSNSSFFTMLNADGTPDVSFNSNAVAAIYYNSAQVSDFGYQPDGKIIALGYFTNNRLIVRLNADGTIDTTFTSGTGGNDTLLRDFVIQPDGKMVVVGQFTSFYTVPCNNIFRLNTDGSVDTTFNAGGAGALFGSGTSNINTIELLPNGKMLILGNFGGYNGVSRNNMAVLNQDGSLDTTFNPGGGFVYESSGTANNLNLLAIQPDGKFFVSGQFSNYNGTAVNRLIRINSNGTLDTSFSIGTGFEYPYTISGTLYYSEGDIYSMVIQPDGKLVIGGNFETYNGLSQRNIMRLNANGTMDASFHNGMGTCTDPPTFSGSTLRRGEVYKMIQTPDGKIIIGGGFNWFNYALTGNVARLGANGDLDLTFNPGTGFNNNVTTSTILPDGKIMVAGNFTKYFGVDRKGVARLNTDGSLDTTFNIGTGVQGILNSVWDGLGYSQKVNAMAIQPNDSKILIGGSFKSFNGILKKSFVRLNTNGSVDTSFDVPIIGSGNTVNSLSSINVLSDGKILTIINGSLVRLNSNGTLDGSFTSISATNLSLLADGRLYVMNNSVLKRYTANGVPDVSFATVNITTSYSGIQLGLQSDGKIIIAGNFTAINGMNINNLARINTDGTLDMTFYPSISFVPTMIKVLPNDKMLLVEQIYSPSQAVKLYKFSANGTLEATYAEFGSYDPPWVYPLVNNMTIDEGKIYLGGSFVSVNGVGRNRFVRLLDPDISLGVNNQSNSGQMTICPNPTNSILNINVPDGVMIDKVEVYNNLGQLVVSQKSLADTKILNVNNLRSGIYYLRINADNKLITRKFIKE